MDARLLQLADSAFPTGGFAHSAGLEAAWQQGEVEDLGAWLDQHLWQTGFSSLPFVAAAFDQPARLGRLDSLCDAFLSNPVAKRASRLQGRAFLRACAAAFESPRIGRWARRPVHHAPAFGAAAALLGLERGQALEVFLFLALRGAVSAAVRLGIAGPLEGQELQARRGPLIAQVARRCRDLSAAQAAQTWPVADLLQSTQDRLYSRLFQS